MGSIAEQRQIFKGADHAFLWKPKLRIPDIDNSENQRAFGQLLHHCSCCSTERELIDGIETIDRRAIKGLGPAVANLLYFLHPTLMPPFNTAIVNGFNAVTGSKVKLGRWDHYLAMRAGRPAQAEPVTRVPRHQAVTRYPSTANGSAFGLEASANSRPANLHAQSPSRSPRSRRNSYKCAFH